MKATPLRDYLVIRDIQLERKSDGGIILLKEDDVESDMKYGVVVAAGPGRLDTNGARIPLSVSVGDTVMFDRTTLTKVIEHDGSQHRMIMESQILGVLDN